MASVALVGSTLTLTGDVGPATLFRVRIKASDATKVEAFAGAAAAEFNVSAITALSFVDYEPIDAIHFDQAVIDKGWPFSITLAGGGKLKPSQITPDNVPPGPPSNLAAAAVTTGVQLTWDRNPEPDVAGYHVYATDTDPDADPSAQFNKLSAALLPNPNHFDSTIPAGGAPRWYRVYAVDASGNFSEPSQIRAGRDDLIPPAAPASFTATAAATQIDLAWAANTEPDLGGYRLTRALSDPNGTYHPLNGGVDLAKTATTFADTAAPANIDCFYRLSAVDVSGNVSGPSTATAKRVVADATPPNQPTGFIGTGGASGVTLVWNASPETDLAGYNVYRQSQSGYQKLNTAPLTVLTYFDSAALVNVTSHYQLTAVDTSANESTPAATAGTRTGGVVGDPPTVPLEGWTEFPLRPTARRIHVSSSLGKDTNNGLAENVPLKTIAAGYRLLRDGRGDQLLLKRGDVFTDLPIRWGISGFSAAFPVLLGAYGNETLERPKWRCRAAANSGGILADRENRYVAIAHVEFYCPGRNPADPDFDDRAEGGYAIRVIRKQTSFLVEGCRFGWYSYNFAHDLADTGEANNPNPDGAQTTGLVFRRNVFTDAWARKQYHGNGIYLSDVADAKFEQNYWIHNGWAVGVGTAGQATQRTMWRHNAYIDEYKADNGPAEFIEEVCIDGGNYNIQCRPGGTIKNCLLIRGSYNASLFGFQGTFSSNVVYDSAALGSGPQSVGIEIGCLNSTVKNNLFFRPAGGTNVGGHAAILLNLRDERKYTPPGKLVSTIKNNTVFRWNADAIRVSQFWDELTITGNKGVSCTGSGLPVLNGGVGKSNVANNVTAAVFPDSTVTPPADLATTARAQRRGNWNDALTAAVINDTLRAGFAVTGP